jgi:ferritin-like metal-binding protein YciE
MATAAKKTPAKKPQKQNPDLQELLLTELKEIYSAEKQASRALPRLTRSVEAQAVREQMETRLQQGERIIEALDQAFERLETSPGRKKNVAAEGLLADAQEHVQEIEKGPALDAVLIGAIQKLEHYCIAAWGTSRAIAEVLGEQEVVQAMQQAIDEGEQLDQRLTDIAEQELYPAMQGGGDVDGEERSFQAGEEGEESADEEEASSGGGRGKGKGKGGEARA